MIINKKNWSKFFLAACILSSNAYANSTANQICTLNNIEKFKIFLNIKNDPDNSRILMTSCKKMPENESLTIVVTIYRDERSIENISIMLIDSNEKITSSYKKSLPDDMSMSSGSINIDTAPYKVSSNVRAFAVDIYESYAPHCYEAWTEGYRTLYIKKENKIVPILENIGLTGGRFLNKKSTCEPPENGKNISTENFKTNITILKTITNGFFDIGIVKKITYLAADSTPKNNEKYKDQNKLEKVFKYNGEIYKINLNK